MVTRYIVDNATSQTIQGSLNIQGGTVIGSTGPNYPIGASGDKKGQIAFDNNYFYYCTNDFEPGNSFTISGGGTTHIFDSEPGIEWNGYGGDYLQTGPSQELGVNPLNGWYIVDDNGNIRQVIGGFWVSPAAPYPNGTGWIMTLDGPFTYSVSNPTITFYESLPTVTFGGLNGDIWRSIKLDQQLGVTATYRALLTHTGTITGTNLGAFQKALIPGETYTITNYISGDDFSNIANVTSGTINTSGCTFIATGEIPLIWDQGSELQSAGNLLVQVLENGLGYDIQWSTFFGPGTYLGFRVYPNSNGLFNDFPRTQTSSIISQSTLILNGPPAGPITQFIGPASFNVKDDCIAVYNFNYDSYSGQDYWLYYTPIEIKLNRNLDTTPVVVNGTIEPSFPFVNVSFDLIDDGYIYIDSIYSGVGTTVNNMTELLDLLNTNDSTSYFGTYEDNGVGGIRLSMPANLKEQFSPTGTLTISIFQD